MTPFSQNRIVIALGWPSVAEVPASGDASASCYNFAEHVPVLAVVMAKLKLREVERQILFADVVIRPDDSALEQRPERFDVIGMNFATHVFERLVIHGLMRECLIECLITRALVSRDQINLFRNHLADETGHGFHRSIFDDLASDVTFARDRAGDGDLATGPRPLRLKRLLKGRFAFFPPI